MLWPEAAQGVSEFPYLKDLPLLDFDLDGLDDEVPDVHGGAEALPLRIVDLNVQRPMARSRHQAPNVVAPSQMMVFGSTACAR